MPEMSQTDIHTASADLALPVDHGRIIALPRIVDERDGVISVAETERQIPFPIRRVYYIYDLLYRESLRGKHAHRTLEQVLFCLNGSVVVDLDDGRRRFSVKLEHPHLGLYLGPGLWHVMRLFSHRCVLMVLASAHYDEGDYIRDYDEFLRFTAEARP